MQTAVKVFACHISKWHSLSQIKVYNFNDSIAHVKLSKGVCPD